MHAMHKRAAFALFAALACGGAMAAKQAPISDRDFVTRASASGLAEVQASQLAQERTTSSAIKAFAGTMVSDHTRANQQLQTIAQKNGLTAASSPDADAQAHLKTLEGLQGDAFDRAYVTMMRKDHHAAVALFRREANGAGNAELKAFAAQTLPTLRQHTHMAEQLWAQTGKQKDAAAAPAPTQP